MKTTIPFLFLMLSLVGIAPGQTTPAPTPFVWSVKDTEHCKQIIIDDVPYKLIRINNIVIGMGSQFVDKYMAVDLYIANIGSSNFDVIPATDIYLAAYEKETDVKDKKDPSIIIPATPKEIRDKIGKRGRWGNFFGSLSAGMATNTSTIWDYQTGTYATVTTPNYGAQQAAREQAQRTATNNAITADAVEARMFKGNTVLPGRSVVGTVFFKDKKHEMDTINLRINGVDYVFIQRWKTR